MGKTEEDNSTGIKEQVDLELEDQQLEAVTISDGDIAEGDKQSRAAARQARKLARAARTPEQRKAARRKRILVGGVAILVVIALVLAIPASRWWTLNSLGFRGKVILSLQQGAKQQPIMNAAVKLDSGQYGVSDSFGRVYFEKVRLGPRRAVVDKIGYAQQQINFTASLGTTRPAVAKVQVIGIKFDVTVKDWLSGGIIAGATVSSGDARAQSDKNGVASVVVPPTEEKKISLVIEAANYLPKTIELEPSVAAREAVLVSAAKNYFISKRDATFDIFSSNLDGSNQQKIIQATGSEQADLLQFSIHRSNKQAVLVATREVRQQGNRIITGIYAVDLERATLRKIDDGSEVRVLDWAEDSLVYTKAAPQLNYDDASFARIMSFNAVTGKLSQLAQANYFPVSLVLQNKVVYMPADAYRPIENAELTSLEVNSGARKTYLAGKQWSFGVRASYDLARLQTTDGQKFELQARGTTRAVDQPPGNNLSFALSNDGSQVAWADSRDGQGALLVRNLKDGTERVVAKSAGLTTPVRWLSDSLVVVRIATSQETSDYVLHVGTGKLAKIVDVTNVGLQRPDTL